MKLVGPRLRQDFDPPVTELVVFRRKRILVDANLADGSFRRQLPGREAVDINLSAIRACRRPSQRLQLGLQLIRIIGKRFEILSLHHNRARVIRGIHVHLRRRVRDLDLFLLHLDGQLDIQLF